MSTLFRKQVNIFEKKDEHSHVCILLFNKSFWQDCIYPCEFKWMYCKSFLCSSMSSGHIHVIPDSQTFKGIYEMGMKMSGYAKKKKLHPEDLYGYMFKIWRKWYNCHVMVWRLCIKALCEILKNVPFLFEKWDQIDF